jgi:hypothetical protein
VIYHKYENDDLYFEKKKLRKLAKLFPSELHVVYGCFALSLSNYFSASQLLAHIANTFNVPLDQFHVL